MYLGRHQQQLFNANEESRRVSQVINHPNYNSQTQNNDISLLQLSSSLTFTNYIRPICLAASGSSYEGGGSVWITGWGTINSGGDHDVFNGYEGRGSVDSDSSKIPENRFFAFYQFWLVKW